MVVGVPGDERRILQGIVVDGGDDAFDRRQQVDRGSGDMDRRELLSLAYPTVGSDGIDALDFTNQVGDERIGADARVLRRLLRSPSMSGMKAVALGNFEAKFSLQARGSRCGQIHPRRECDLWTPEITDAHDQQKHEQYE